MPQWNDLIYGITIDDEVILGCNCHDYSKDLEVLEFIKRYKKVVLQDNFNAPLDFLPDGVEELTLGTNFNQPLANLPSSIKKIVFEGDGYYNSSTKFSQPLDYLPFGLEELRICIDGKNTVIGSGLPASLKKLEILGYYGNIENIHINDLPDSLEYLGICIDGFDYYSISKLPTNLKDFVIYLNLLSNATDKIIMFLNKQFPQVIITIYDKI